MNSIADEMAVALTRTARSLGVKDARDFSIAICDPDGEPVSSGVGLAIHLGAIPSALAAVKAHFKNEFEPGDVIFTNDPYSGGMHLPDIFVIKPLVFEGALLGFAAVVAHMADIGGRVPGGNAADSVSIHQEGLRIPPIKLYRRGRLSEDWIALVRANVRQPDMVIGDIFAEVAACTAAEREFIRLVQRYGKDALLTHMTELIAHGERMARTALTHFNPGSYRFIDHLDDDGLGGEPVPIKVHLEIGKEKIRVDLAGTADQVRGAINAPLCVTRSTVAYLVATMIPGELPTSAGISRVFELAVPEGSIANMLFPAACAARAVTAYRVLDALFGALAQAMPNRIPAAGDGGPS
ncbi:MAG: hydantoinase B/oxoprolinase family protein, partial [bacterium]